MKTNCQNITNLGHLLVLVASFAQQYVTYLIENQSMQAFSDMPF